MQPFNAAWFDRHQAQLLWWLNTPVIRRWFRWVLRIRACDVGYRREIVRLLPHAYVVRSDRPGHVVADFRTHQKYAKRLYYAFRPLWWTLHAWDWAIADRWWPEYSFGFGTLTQYPDAYPEVITMDGYVRRHEVDETWATIRGHSEATQVSNSGTDWQFIDIQASTTANQWKVLGRAMFLFDTSAIGSGSTVISAILSLFGHTTTTKQDDLVVTPNIDIVTATPASDTALALGDFDQVGSTSQTGAAKTYASWTAAYNAFTFDATGRGNVSTTGISRFATRNKNYDTDNVMPTWSSDARSYLAGYLADQIGETNDPKLVVEFAADVPVLIEIELNSVWTDVSDDVIGPVHLKYGAWDSGPVARVSQTGTCSFGLRNSTRSSGGVLGYYSPGHTDVRIGFRRGIRVRVKVKPSGGTQRTKFSGKIHSIEPTAGLYGDRRTVCTAVDWIDELSRFEARELAPQENKTADQLLTTLVAAMPTDAQPVAQSFAAGIDTFPYVWSDLGEGRNGLQVAADVVLSDLGYLQVIGDGTLKFFTRQSEAALGAGFTVTDTSVRDVVTPSSLDQAYNVVRIVTHPKRVPTATIVLWAKAADDAPKIPGSGSLTLWVTYRNPTNEDVLIGGQSGQFVTPVSTTDYVGNAAADGSGADRTANITITATFFATVAKLVIDNSHASDVYMTTLQIRGKGIYDLDPVAYESSSTQTFGRRQLDIDMLYAEDGNVAQDLANYLRSQFDALDRYVTEVELKPHTSAAILQSVIDAEPGDGMTVTETVTGLSTVSVRINGVELEVENLGRLLVRTARFAVAPRFESDAWILDDPVRSILGTTTVLGAF